jgi:fructokinase
MTTYRFGIDLGGTKIELAALGADGAIAWRRRIPSPSRDYQAVVTAMAGLVEDAERELGATGTVGVATPGATSLATDLIKNSNSTSLNGKPLRADLERRLARPVRLANDADCFALSEATDGAARGARSVFGVILGTGVGGGIVVGGQLLAGPNAIAGEWGHNPLPLPTHDDLPLPLCYCRRRGCIETYLSGPGMANDHARAAGERLTAAAIAQRAAAGDAACEATLARYEARLARALASVINVLDPEVIVLGGGLSHVERLYERVPQLWGAFVFSDDVRTRLVAPAHGDASGVRGAAWLWSLGEAQAQGRPVVSLREVDDSNIDWLAEVHVAPHQIYHVASVGKTFWQARDREDFWIRGIFADETPVGLVAVIDPALRGAPGPHQLYLARLLVDQHHQGRGYGRYALEQVIAMARARPDVASVKLSHMPDNAAVGRMYERHGFRYTGSADSDGELEMVLELRKPRADSATE